MANRLLPKQKMIDGKFFLPWLQPHSFTMKGVAAVRFWVPHTEDRLTLDRSHCEDVAMRSKMNLAIET